MKDEPTLRALGKEVTTARLRAIVKEVCARPLRTGPIRKYAIVSTPRVGSTLLASCLAATGALGWPLEWFNARYVQEFVEILGHMSGDDFVEMLIRRTASANGIFGVNFHVSQYLDWKERGFNLLSLGFSKVYWMERSDRISQAYSFAKALKTDLWSKDSEEAAGYCDGVPVEVSPQDVAKTLTAISRDETHREEFPIDRRYVYEALVGRLDDVVGEILHDFGERPVRVQPATAPQSTRFDKERVSAIRRYFMGGAD